MQRVMSVLAAVVLFLPVATFAGGAQGSGVRTIEITGDDEMKFSVTTIEAKPGERIRIVLKSVGKLPKQVMAHNFVLLPKDLDVVEFVNQSARARATQYIAPAFKDKVLAATGLAGAGETTEVTFTAPKAPGSYPYVCSFAGHYQAGMKGTLIVK